MGGSSFDLLLEEVRNQQRAMEELQARNDELRQQLALLRNGQGIVIEICGQRFTLASNSELEAVNNKVAATQQVNTDTAKAEVKHTVAADTTVREAKKEKVAGTTSDTAVLAPLEMAEQPTTEVADVPSPIAAEETREEPALPTPIAATEQKAASTFLEEIMLDEFASQLTTPLAVWNGPPKKQDTSDIDEEQKAILRRELMGSFLLE